MRTSPIGLNTSHCFHIRVWDQIFLVGLKLKKYTILGFRALTWLDLKFGFDLYLFELSFNRALLGKCSNSWSNLWAPVNSSIFIKYKRSWVAHELHYDKIILAQIWFEKILYMFNLCWLELNNFRYEFNNIWVSPKRPSRGLIYLLHQYKFWLSFMIQACETTRAERSKINLKSKFTLNITFSVIFNGQRCVTLLKGLRNIYIKAFQDMWWIASQFNERYQFYVLEKARETILL